MKQLTQKLKSGSMQVLDVPEPLLGKGMVLVRNHYSLISAGTEGGTVSAARKSLIGKALERPQQAKQALDLMWQQGPIQAYRAVMKKLDAYSPLGYSSAGVIIGIAPDVKGFKVGDSVACAGNNASHSEVIAVPVNLCVNLRRLKAEGAGRNENKGNEGEKLFFKRAAYNTLGAIALQGIRQADLRLGETCAVIGLGLIGQLTGLMLRAAGVRVVGIDVDLRAVKTAQGRAVDAAFERGVSGIESKIDAFTLGLGCDAVIITAGTSSLDPVNFAGAITRKKGKIIVLGAVPTGFDREPYYYKKELELRMSTSYGPGRYDPTYEEKGLDYPPAYVRWTEKRNMEAFQELVHSRKIDLDYLISHIFRLDDSPKAYDLILKKQQPYLGILIEYAADLPKPAKARIPVRQATKIVPSGTMPVPGIAFIGAGSYAQSHLLPNLPSKRQVQRVAVLAANGAESLSAAKRFKFETCTADEKEIFENPAINAVFIATRHDSHAEYVIKALKAGKNIFVEKPLCLNEKELNNISALYESRIRNHEPHTLMLGFNRRFSPLTVLLKERMGEGQMAMMYRINAGAVPADSWIQDPAVGGGRVVGEVCHFIDLLAFINGSLPVSVFALAVHDADDFNDTLNISLVFQNGSLGTISYFANGSKTLPKEYLEVHGSGTSAVLEDFKRIEIHSTRKVLRKKLFSQNKGQWEMVSRFIASIREGSGSPIEFKEIHAATLATFKILESLRKGEKIPL